MGANPNIRVSDVEFSCAKTSFTAATVAYLDDAHRGTEFSLIMGEDNLRTFHKWKNHEAILENHHIFVYPRVLTIQEKEDLKPHRTMAKIGDNANIHQVDAPVMKLSASFVRDAIKRRHDVKYLLTEPVYIYLKEMHFYE